MGNKPYQSRLRDFVKEIQQLDLPAFVALDRWCLLEEIQNAVNIGYVLTSPSDRKILHHIGQRYGLIPICPGDVVDLDLSSGSMQAVVITPFGNLRIRQPE